MRRRPRFPWIGAGFVAVLLLAACRRADRIEPPRSLFLVTIDTLRADHVNARLTPALDSLGREAVVFDQALTVAPLTLPAHASLLTGTYPPRHRVHDNELFALPDDVPTFQSFLKRHGYATGGFVSAPVLDHRYGLNRGFDVYDDEIVGPERSAPATLERAERWLDAAPQPFFAWVHLFEPHAPYRTGSYAGEVTAVDHAVDGLFKYLRGRGLWSNLVLAVTADHGESLGEHGERTHGFFLYDATLRIPWILKAPHLAARHVPDLVRIVDVMPTMLELANLSTAAEREPPLSDGVSLAALLLGATRLNLEAFGETFLPRDQFGWSALTSLRTSHVKYIAAPRPEFYDVVADPGETDNVIASRTADADRLREALAAIVRRPTLPPRRAASDPLITERLMSLGYIAESPATGMPSDESLADPKTKIDVYNLVMEALETSENGDVAGALVRLQTAERIDPNVAQIEFLKGTLLGQLGRYADAASALERALALNPRHESARFKLALALLRTGHADRAAAALQDIVREQPENFRAWHNLAAIAYSRGDLDRAETLERKALAASPEYGEAWNTLGAIALVRHDVDAAIDALTKATRFEPANAQAFENLSRAFREAGNVDRARAAADRACALDRRLCSTPGGPRP